MCDRIWSPAIRILSSSQKNSACSAECPPAVITRHSRFPMQPFDAPPDAADVEDIIDQIGSEKMFLFASDYPHWQFEGDDPVPPNLPKSLVARMSSTRLNTAPLATPISAASSRLFSPLRPFAAMAFSAADIRVSRCFSRLSKVLAIY